MFSFAIFLRTFLENFTNSNNQGMINGFIDTFFHYPIWFLTIFVGIMVVISIFSEKPILKTLKVVSYGSFIILLPPIIDIFLINTRFVMILLLVTARKYWNSIFRYLLQPITRGWNKNRSYTCYYGSILLCLFKKKNIVRSLLAAWLSYTIIFGMLILPDVVYFISGFFILLPKISILAIQNYFSQYILMIRFFFLDHICLMQYTEGHRWEWHKIYFL